MPECDGNDPAAYSRRNLGGRLRRYKRSAPQNASGTIDNTLGVRELIVGTSGADLERQEGNSELSRVLNATIHDAVMRLQDEATAGNSTKPVETVSPGLEAVRCHGKDTYFRRPLSS
jgi:hypothetical protein